MGRFKEGDVLSYSSGRGGGGPYGFRIVGASSDSLWDALQRKLRCVFEGFGDRLPLAINAYPAAIGGVRFGVSVDTYLSPSVGTRALWLAYLEGMPALLLGQPLFVADLLMRHVCVDGGRLPDTLVLGVGGYVMPMSLERALREVCCRDVRRFSVFHAYGVAEVDAACLLAVERGVDGALIYEPRSDHVEVELDDDERLLLSLLGHDGTRVIERFHTGDCGRAVAGGYAIWNHDRLHPDVAKMLESWTVSDWRRRTGYLVHGAENGFQTRQGVAPSGDAELEFYDFAARYGQSWLAKPEWGAR